MPASRATPEMESAAPRQVALPARGAQHLHARAGRGPALRDALVPGEGEGEGEVSVSPGLVRFTLFF